MEANFLMSVFLQIKVSYVYHAVVHFTVCSL